MSESNSSLWEGSHPIWALTRMVTLTGCLAFILWMTAFDFDETEAKTIGAMTSLFAAFEIGPKMLKKVVGA